jgi:hypothetical protein
MFSIGYEQYPQSFLSIQRLNNNSISTSNSGVHINFFIAIDRTFGSYAFSEEPSVCDNACGVSSYIKCSICWL